MGSRSGFVYSCNVVVKIVSLGVWSGLNNSGVHPVAKAELRENVISARDCLRSRVSYFTVLATSISTFSATGPLHFNIIRTSVETILLLNGLL